MTDVKGYTPLSEVQKETMNNFKQLEEQIFLKIDELRNSDMIDKVALEEGAKKIIDSFMWLNRSIAKPNRIGNNSRWY